MNKLSADEAKQNSHSHMGVFQENILKKTLSMSAPLLSLQMLLSSILAEAGSALKRPHLSLKAQERALWPQLLGLVKGAERPLASTGTCALGNKSVLQTLEAAVL